MAVLPPELQDDLRVVPIDGFSIDALPVKVDFFPSPETHSFRVRLELAIPEIDRYRASAFNAQNFIAALENAVTNSGFRIRLTLVSDTMVRSERERVQEDGSIRELLPAEGTW